MIEEIKLNIIHKILSYINIMNKNPHYTTVNKMSGNIEILKRLFLPKKIHFIKQQNCLLCFFL
jgi:hypothetical protein